MKNTDIIKIYIGDKEIPPLALKDKVRPINVLKQPISIPFREKGKYQLGDVAFYSKRQDKIVVVAYDENFPDGIIQELKSNYYPIGVVAIPSSHDVYGTGECGIVSLQRMDCNYPDTGEISDSGKTDVQLGDYSTLLKLGIIKIYDKVPIVNRKTNKFEGFLDTLNITLGFPNQYVSEYSGVKCTYDPDAGYYPDGVEGYIPSPYLKGNLRNPNYYSDTENKDNGFADFNGKEISNRIITLEAAQADWKTASTIINGNATNYYPAFWCAWRYHTLGTKQGDWYIPTLGETGYVYSRERFIGLLFDDIMNKFGIKCNGPSWKNLNLGPNFSSIRGNVIKYVSYMEDSSPSAFLRLE